MRTLILGTAGHIDHGKTALVRALTGVDTDRLPEEKQRGITIDIGFARLALDDETEIGIVDVPGHEAFIRNMLAGATGIDIAALVIAADEGVMPQTREHLSILELLGVRSVLVVLSKADLVEAEWLGLVREDVAALMRETSYAAAPVIPVSAVTGSGLDTLRETLTREAKNLEARDVDDLFRLPIDRVFTVKGTGTVITGTVWSGKIGLDATATLLPHGDRVRIRGIQTHGQERHVALAGQRAALALAGTSRDGVGRGDSLVAHDAWSPTSIVTVRLHVLSDSPPVRTRQRVRFHLGTAEVLGRVALLEPGAVEPGSEGWAQIRLEQPVVARAGDRFVLRSYSPVTTIAGGRVVEPVAPKRKRAPPELRQDLAAVLEPDSAVAAAASLAGFAGIPLGSLPLLVPRETTRKRPDTMDGFMAGGRLFHAPLVTQAADVIRAAVARFHERQPLAPGIPRETLRQVLPAHAHPALVDAVIERLVETEAIAADGPVLRDPSFVATLDPAQQQAAARIETLFLEAGLASPARDEIPDPLATRADLDDLLHYLQRSDRLIALPGHRWVHPTALEKAIQQVRERFAGRQDLGPADFRELFGISRKYLIPLLEHFDRTGVTARVGESRRVETSVRG